MANQENYRSNLQELSEQYTRYNVSRVIANKKDNLLDMEVPATFSDELLKQYVEVNLYSLSDNSLVFSDIIKNVSGSIYTKRLQYNDSSLRTLLFIDFGKIESFDVPVGQYEVTLNFLEDEVGTYEDRGLKVSTISPSRLEVELELTNPALQRKLEQFAIPRIPAIYIEGVLKQIFNQEQAPTNIPISPASINSTNVYSNFTSGSGELLIEYGFDEDDGSRIGINTITQNVLNDAYPLARLKVLGMIQSGSTSFTETELFEYVTDAIDQAYDLALDDEAQNPQNYRFDLL